MERRFLNKGHGNAIIIQEQDNSKLEGRSTFTTGDYTGPRIPDFHICSCPSIHI
jgi:hypothetical protein